MNCVYILYSESLDKYYVGEASNLDERVEQHNSGFYNSAFTKQVSDWKLFHVMGCEDRV